ncbi:MAG: hypothetical protein OEY27_03895 [Gammaproteobacteria bacterium]|nr:hypothetical protein [Gammaproteobacteria bacterium]
MANFAGITNNFKTKLLTGSHAFSPQDANTNRTVTTADTMYMALYLSSATITFSTATAYTTAGELIGTGYTASGNPLTSTLVSSNGTSSYWTASSNVTWTALTASTAIDCALMYNFTATTKAAVAVFTFSSQTVTAADFTLAMPTNDGATALIRVV